MILQIVLWENVYIRERLKVSSCIILGRKCEGREEGRRRSKRVRPQGSSPTG
jgi:hypothetical protein